MASILKGVAFFSSFCTPFTASPPYTAPNEEKTSSFWSSKESSSNKEGSDKRALRDGRDGGFFSKERGGGGGGGGVGHASTFSFPFELTTSVHWSDSHVPPRSLSHPGVVVEVHEP